MNAPPFPNAIAYRNTSTKKAIATATKICDAGSLMRNAGSIAKVCRVGARSALRRLCLSATA